jgi:hypothetical protein
MKKDIFDLKFGESKRFDRPQIFFVISGGVAPNAITKNKTYGVWYTKHKGVKYFYLKSKKDNSSRWSWCIEANRVFTTLEDAKIGVKHHFIKRYEELLKQRKEDLVRISNLLKDSTNFNVVELMPSSYDKNRWTAVPKFREGQHLEF